MRKNLLARALLLSLTLGSTGCSWFRSPISPDEMEQGVAKVEELGGYHHDRQHPLQFTRETWNRDGNSLDILYTAPSDDGRFPLLVYLPGLGEDAEAGALWREAWAKAGYAVLSVQSLAVGPGLWASREARSDRAAIARQKLSGPALRQRGETLVWILEEFLRRKSISGSPFQQADPTRLGLIGFELGAQLVAEVSGMHASGAPLELPKAYGLKAAIVLSPPVDLASGKLESRFTGLNLPLLVIFGSEDTDPYGITSTSTQKAFWQFSPAGDKYLLELGGATHALLSGQRPGAKRKPLLDRDEKEAREEGMEPSPEERDDAGGRRGRGGYSEGGFSPAKARALNFKQVAALRNVSGAFLDRYVLQEVAAETWLTHQAKPWLRGYAQLRIR